MEGCCVRSEYLKDKGLPALVAVYQNVTGDCIDIALSYGFGIGSDREAILETMLDVETETDLFGGFMLWSVFFNGSWFWNFSWSWISSLKFIFWVY
ncbi:MAG: hypothetical protein ACRC4L_03415 [Mycoplasma sp.]